MSAIMGFQLTGFLRWGTYLLSFRMATFSAEKSGLSSGSSDQHFVIILMISSSSAHSSSTIGLKGLLPDWLGRRTDSTISENKERKGFILWKFLKYFIKVIFFEFYYYRQKIDFWKIRHNIATNLKLLVLFSMGKLGNYKRKNQNLPYIKRQ